MRILMTIPVVLALAGCSQEKSPAAGAEQPAAVPAAAAHASDTASAPAVASGSAVATAAAAPTGRAASTASAAGSVSGRVLETLDSAGYTYLRLEVPGGEIWAAVTTAKVRKGATVTVENATPMDGFESKTLHRKFDRIVFGTLADGPAAAAAGAPAPLPPGHPESPDPRLKEMMAAQHAAAAQGPAGASDVKVARSDAPNGKTVAEIFSGRVALKDTEVVVRGKVVKFLPGIMGRNWLHLRDGSGSAEKKNNDITVTTSETAFVGDVVVVKGKVHTDRDFGAGYAYPVLIEEATISGEKGVK